MHIVSWNSDLRDDPSIAADLKHFPGSYEDPSLLRALNRRRAEERQQQRQGTEPCQQALPVHSRHSGRVGE